MTDVDLVSWKIEVVRNPSDPTTETGYTIEMTDADGRTYTVKGTGTIQVSDPEGVPIGPTLHKPAIKEARDPWYCDTWYCDTCRTSLPGNQVTNDERHDERTGGCGEVVVLIPDHCPDGLLPDGNTCPRCFKKRAPSGVGGGTWVHVRGG